LRGKVHVLAQHSKPVSNVAWSPDDAMLLTSSDTSIKLWNTSTGRVIADCYGKHDQSVTGLTWMPDNRHFISAGLDRKMYLWVRDITFGLKYANGRTPLPLFLSRISRETSSFPGTGQEYPTSR